MAEVTGPISTLPGYSHKVPKGCMCDDHPNRVATHRIQGETDSFGCEMIDMCDECYEQYKKEVAEYDTSGTCDWCGHHSPKLRNYRDFEEGSCGRVYQVCSVCISNHLKAMVEELAGYDYDELWDAYDD